MTKESGPVAEVDDLGGREAALPERGACAPTEVIELGYKSADSHLARA